MVKVRSFDIRPNSWLIRVSVLRSKLTQEFPNYPSVKGVSEKTSLFDEALAEFKVSSPPTVAV